MKTKCKACGKEIIFLRTAKGRNMPTDWESLPSADQRNASEGIPPMFDALKKSILATARVGMAKKDSSFGEKKKLKPKEPKPKEQLELF